MAVAGRLRQWGSKMTPEPRGIPRRTFLRMARAILLTRSHDLIDLCRRAGKRDRRGHVVSPEKSQARAVLADTYSRAAGVISGWIADDREYSGAPLDAALCGYLLAWLQGDHDSLTEARAELADIGLPPVLNGVAGDDYIGGIAALLRGTK